jgi:hypothetical protein
MPPKWFTSRNGWIACIAVAGVVMVWSLVPGCCCGTVPVDEDRSPAVCLWRLIFEQPGTISPKPTSPAR